MEQNGHNRLEAVVSLAKRRGFIFPGSEIYGGLAGSFDYGPLGALLKERVKQAWLSRFVYGREDMHLVDTTIIMNPRVWQASGHTATFADPLVECTKCHHRFREDHLENKKVCPDCGGELGEVQKFNMMFETKVGAGEDALTAYLRPETAQGMFANFKNVVDSLHPKLPFGLAQIGRAFRNEIAPRDFLFRSREFEQMEIEYFIRPDAWKASFEEWRAAMKEWIAALGLSGEKVHELEVAAEDRAHYSERTIDFEYDFPFGRKELYGLAYRTDYDLKAHQAASGQSLEYFDEETKEKLAPHVIEPSFGLDRTILALLCEHYAEDELGEGKRIFLKFPKEIAPVRAAVFPLLKNKPELVAKAREVCAMLKKEFPTIVFDDNGNIGKRYRRQDEIGTPTCITIDFDTLGETPEHTDTVTVRDRDTGEQKRVAIAELVRHI